MSIVSKSFFAVAATLLVGIGIMPRAAAGPLDGLAGAAVGFALGAMVAAPRPRYYSARPRTVVVYRNRRARGTYASAPARRQGAGVIPARINTASDPFAGSAQPIPVRGN
ncbi:hypothetical protein [Methylorubrum salsuginis]|uniref:Uncharacterized protein n=1 Tax=Methylorubrum salsuginis TaxID=414703 RepID=A0A1I4CZG8_9HYPH|nr:hypothetical protein [Methylorubrum salsuginis]SFK85819.1 hypothetical protein SAMN04488125_10567 [Methylorubrum salsuginis]